MTKDVGIQHMLADRQTTVSFRQKASFHMLTVTARKPHEKTAPASATREDSAQRCECTPGAPGGGPTAPERWHTASAQRPLQTVMK